MKVAVTILIILTLAVAGLLVAVFWEQIPGGVDYEPSVPYDVPEPPPGPEAAESPSPGSFEVPAETPASDQGAAAETGSNSDSDSVLTPPPFESPTPTPAPNPDEIPPESPDLVNQEADEAINDRRSIMLMQAEELYLAGSYDEALALIRKDETLYNDDTARLETEILNAMG